MTRRQVAQRLGKSLATVRRIEGVLLHPSQDSRGVRQFDADEVEQLARGMETGQVALWHQLKRGTPASGTNVSGGLEIQRRGCDACTELERQVEDLRGELYQLRDRHRRDLEELGSERRELEKERRELEAQLVEFMAVVDSLTQ